MISRWGSRAILGLILGISTFMGHKTQFTTFVNFVGFFKWVDLGSTWIDGSGIDRDV
jgi:hypothetical protein